MVVLATSCGAPAPTPKKPKQTVVLNAEPTSDPDLGPVISCGDRQCSAVREVCCLAQRTLRKETLAFYAKLVLVTIRHFDLETYPLPNFLYTELRPHIVRLSPTELPLYGSWTLHSWEGLNFV